MRVTVDGRLPNQPDHPNFILGLLGILRDLANNLNEVTDIVMARAVHSPAITADALVKSGKAVYHGISITSATASGTIDIRDGVAAGGGVIIDTIPSGTASGTYIENVVGVICDNGIYVDYNSAVGTVVILYE